MFSKNRFKAAVLASGLTLDEVAKIAGCHRGSLSKKMNGHSDFTRGEIERLMVGLNIEDPREIFFNL